MFHLGKSQVVLIKVKFRSTIVLRLESGMRLATRPRCNHQSTHVPIKPLPHIILTAGFARLPPSREYDWDVYVPQNATSTLRMRQAWIYGN
jgi:hypothetical protein